MTPLVTASRVSLELSRGRELFKDLNLSLGTKRTALVGPNGVGKTCLAKLLAGLLEPTRGEVHRRSALAYLPQRRTTPLLSVADHLCNEYEWSLWGERLLDGIDRDSPCPTLSGGEWMRVRLACVLTDRFLLLDEPTNDLDREGREILLEFLRGHDAGALLISHDRECLSLCDEVLELSNRGLTKFGGGWAFYTDAKAREREAFGAVLERAKRERTEAGAERAAQVARQEKRNRRGAEAAARGGLPKILLGRRKRLAQSSTGKVDTATADRANDAVREAHDAFAQLKLEPVMYADLFRPTLHAQKLVLEARGFNIRYDDWLYRDDLSFTWRGPVRIALKGGNGTGKSSLVRALLGEKLSTRGKLIRGGLAALYVDQRCGSLVDEKSVLDNMRDVSLKSETELRNGLAKFLFARESVFHPVRELSGGERLRATLARGFLSADAPELLILDEPTNNLDLANVDFLERLVRQFRGALLVISHDEVFLRNCDVLQELTL